MNPTTQTLLEQMRITELDIQSRKSLLDIDDIDISALTLCRPVIMAEVDVIVRDFYAIQTSIPEIASLIGDAETLSRLRAAQRHYILGLFGGSYGLDYINERLRIGLVHKRIGVEPKLYLSAVRHLRNLVVAVLQKRLTEEHRAGAIEALDKLIHFDVTLVFDAYIQNLISEISAAKMRTEQYALTLETTVLQRTGELRTDPLTGVTSRRFLMEALERILRNAQRRSEPVSLLFLDVDGFKQINDTQGHAQGDAVLRGVGRILLAVTRSEDACIRYGGDEFCVLLVNCTSEQAQEVYVARIERMMHEQLDGLQVSIGIVQTGPQQFDTPDALLTRTDQQMYAVKLRRKLGSPIALPGPQSSG